MQIRELNEAELHLKLVEPIREMQIRELNEAELHLKLEEL